MRDYRVIQVRLRHKRSSNTRFDLIILDKALIYHHLSRPFFFSFLLSPSFSLFLDYIPRLKVYMFALIKDYMGLCSGEQLDMCLRLKSGFKPINFGGELKNCFNRKIVFVVFFFLQIYIHFRDSFVIKLRLGISSQTLEFKPRRFQTL